MREKLVLLLVGLVFIAGTAAAVYKTDIKKANQFYKSGEYRKALRYYKRAYEDIPSLKLAKFIAKLETRLAEQSPRRGGRPGAPLRLDFYFHLLDVFSSENSRGLEALITAKSFNISPFYYQDLGEIGGLFSTLINDDEEEELVLKGKSYGVKVGYNLLSGYDPDSTTVMAWGDRFYSYEEQVPARQVWYLALNAGLYQRDRSKPIVFNYLGWPLIMQGTAKETLTFVELELANKYYFETLWKSLSSILMVNTRDIRVSAKFLMNKADRKLTLVDQATYDDFYALADAVLKQEMDVVAKEYGGESEENGYEVAMNYSSMGLSYRVLGDESWFVIALNIAFSYMPGE